MVTTVNATSARTAGHSSQMLAPRSMIPRIRRRNWVIGSSSAPHCTTSGMPANGNMKPEIRIEGRNTSIATWIAWNWVRVRVEISRPMARLAKISSSAAM